jgi:Protease II
MSEPKAVRVEEKIKFGHHKNEYRGNKNFLTNPPIEMVDNYNWLRGDKNLDPKIFKYLNDENKYLTIL